ncbi:MAG: hypothetical protein RIQ81_511 [Pseudomonadota bacterium]|jgi:hypothetical protein
MSNVAQLWASQTINGQKALVLDGGDTQALRQKAHDLKGAMRTLELACELGAFQALGGEKSEAVTRAIQILTAEAQIILQAYQDK